MTLWLIASIVKGLLSGKKRETHVDHFIPWSFVQADQLWNLVLSCNSCKVQKVTSCR
ncbi:HNH endonuclease domain-containing protein [Bacillus sp. 7884-1]|uniref:HNH endonuclease domain-containing protein n=1 Tax=Bacillus sp. 7884-1 TaxID=2021693 RepID=UPI0027BA9002|nr:HNH endonuclease domain-containing protein [Bacillus sp. 7884-1]